MCDYNSSEPLQRQQNTDSKQARNSHHSTY